MSHLVTIKDIARTLNISISTVSRAMQNTHDVSQQTRAKVLEVASQLNYKPNYTATGLAKGKSFNIGIILPWITNYYFSTVIAGIQEMAYSKNYNITLYLTNDSPERELAIVNNLSIANIDGLLVSTSSTCDACNHFQEIMNQGIPVVFFDRVPNKINTSKVMQDDFHGAFIAVEHLIEKGYTKIAHIAGPRELSFSEKRLRGYIAALQKHNLLVNEEWIIYSGFSQECGENDTEQLLNSGSIPDAIFAVNDRKAIGSIMALKRNNIQIGKQIGVVGFTNDPNSTIVSPSLTTMSEPAYEIGSKCCELLFKHIYKKRFIPEDVIIPGTLFIRESTER
jgi:LacI family transcriptional regulator